MKQVKEFLKRETVLSAAAALALLSGLIVKPDREYGGYIDYQTIALLFCLMAVMAGFQKMGVFSRIGSGLLSRVSGACQVAGVLVGLCFFSSMAITNDVALITFVPFAITVLGMAGLESMVLPTVVLQTVAANMGSMLTPIGNPQNLYLYSRAGLSSWEFTEMMLPYCGTSLALLAAGVMVCGRGRRRTAGDDGRTAGDGSGAARDGGRAAGDGGKTAAVSGMEAGARNRSGGLGGQAVGRSGRAAGLALMYCLLFSGCVASVAGLVPWQLMLAVTAAAVLAVDRKVFLAVDYSLLLTFAAFFIFIGNMGRIPEFNEFFLK